MLLDPFVSNPMQLFTFFLIFHLIPDTNRHLENRAVFNFNFNLFYQNRPGRYPDISGFTHTLSRESAAGIVSTSTCR